MLKITAIKTMRLILPYPFFQHSAFVYFFPLLDIISDMQNNQEIEKVNLYLSTCEAFFYARDR